MGEGAVVKERKGVPYSLLPNKSDDDEPPERAQDRLYREWKMRINIAERPQEEPLFASPDDLPLPPPLYNRLSENALGDVDAPVDDEQPRCFNCGELGHRIPECTQRRDRQRVASARMRFEAEGQLGSPWGSLTGHSSIDERLAMLRAFAPGEVRGTVLRDALGLHDFRDRGHNAPWMANVAEWGYPPGWYASCDPMAFLRHHVAASERGNNVSSKLFIFADAEVELLDLNSAGDSQEAASPDAVYESVIEQQPSNDEGSSHTFQPRRRWAFYPFRDDLPVYNSMHLPSIGINISPISIPQPFYPTPPSMIVQPRPPPPLLPPPPPTSPPPLPPSSPSPPLPPMPSATYHGDFHPVTASDEGEVDMDMSSDSDS